MLKCKKLMSVVLTLAMGTSLVAPALAAQPQNAMLAEFCEETPYENIYESTNGEYALINNNVVQEVDVLELDASDSATVENLLLDEGIPEEVRNALEKEYQYVLESGETEESIVFITPKAEPMVTSDPMQPPATKYASTTYKNVQMQSWRLDGTTKNTGMKTIQKGVDTYGWASNATNITLAVAGVATGSVVIGLCGVGKALLDVAVWQGDKTLVKGHSKDFTELQFIYKPTEQWTYSWRNNDWVLSLVTEQVLVKRTETRMNYYVTSIDDWVIGTINNSVSKTFSTSDFNSPWAKAYLCGASPETQRLVGKYNGATFDFVA